MMGMYILEGHVPVKVPDVAQWSAWMAEAPDGRAVAQTFKGGRLISTVFLGLDHRFSFSEGEPLLFETMIFPCGSWTDTYCRRCSTWDEAVAQHTKAVNSIGFWESLTGWIGCFVRTVVRKGMPTWPSR